MGNNRAMYKQIFTASLLMVFSLAAMAAPKADLWARWSAHDAQSVESIDHSAWDAFLKKYVVPDGELNRIRYSKVSQADRQALDGYLVQLQNTAISRFNRDEQLAYWINLYNAATVQLIVDNYPVESITDIKSGFLSFGPWDKKLLKVEGEDITLNDIEHRILRPIWNSPLLHYTVNCASVGCPNLVTDAFTASNTWDLARSNARAYINSSRGVKIDKGKLQVSSIFIWFKTDFGGSEKSTIAHLAEFAEPDLARQLTGFGKIHGHDYDWTLNEAN